MGRRRRRTRGGGRSVAASAPDVEDLIGRLVRSEKFGDDVIHLKSLPPAPAAFAEPRAPLPAALGRGLRDLHLDHLYCHQAEAIDRARNGEDVLVVTPTASGKSLVYLLPTFETILTRPGSRALYLFPYKALAQDQMQGIGELSDAVGRHGGLIPGSGGLPGTGGRRVRAEIYDGDTPDARRRKIKADLPDIVVTNPDMLHLGMLAHHEDWRGLFANLAWVVVDELHVYRGLFGSHMHHILRRLRRIAAHHGAAPRFIASSATVANPGGLGEAIAGRPFAVVDRSGAPRAARHVLMLNPGVSPYTAAAAVMAWALEGGFRTIAFTKARRITELLHTWLLQTAPGFRNVVSAYRSGYLPEERRAIERRLFEGSLQGVIATSALEHGVDIGGLDVCILVGYPGSMVSSWQRIGRVGRADRPSLTVLIAMPDALDQYFMTHPEEFFGRGFEEVVFDPANAVIAREHLQCAAAELPIDEPTDRPLYGEAVFGLVADLERAGVLARAADGSRWFSLRRRPQRDVSLRSIGATYTIVDEDADRVIGTIDAVRAFHEAHTGAIYLHHGQQYLVRDLSVEDRRVRAVPVDVEYYTEVRGEKETEVLEVLETRTHGPLAAALGRIKVTERITGYEKRRVAGRDRLGMFELTLPPITFETVGLWIALPERLRDSIVEQARHFMGGIHAAEHAMIGLFPLLAICDRGDIGGISFPQHPQIDGPAIFIYDGHPGGVGLAARGFAALRELVAKTADLIAACRCEVGCPSCIQSPKCGNGNNPLDKEAALDLLEVLAGRRTLAGAAAPSPRPRWIAPPASEPPNAPPPGRRPAIRVMGSGGEGEPAPAVRKRGGEGGQPANEVVLFFDLETQKSAEEVGGWNNIGAMKLALAVTFNPASAAYRTYHEKDVQALLLDLVMADKVIGYNIERFDLQVLQAYSERPLTRVRTFDMLADIYRKLGFRLKLGDLAETTLGVGKIADGLQSLQWWKEGKIDLIEQYCRRDVEVTRNLYEFGRTNGYVLYRDRDGRPVRLPVDWK
jgi:DEAD/DEAH box helicase domain-containing protein